MKYCLQIINVLLIIFEKMGNYLHQFYGIHCEQFVCSNIVFLYHFLQMAIDIYDSLLILHFSVINS